VDERLPGLRRMQGQVLSRCKCLERFMKETIND
jgi:hypothetical protein